MLDITQFDYKSATIPWIRNDQIKKPLDISKSSGFKGNELHRFIIAQEIIK